MSLANILISALYIFYQIITTAILVRCIISWLPLGRDNFFVKLIYSLTEPILGPIRNLINKSPLGGGMMIDFSPIIAYILLQVIFGILVNIISSIF